MVVLASSQLIFFKHAFKSRGAALNLLKRINNGMNYTCLYSTEDNKNEVKDVTNKKNTNFKMSKAMRAYLERAKAYDDFIQKEERDYNIGKVHLSNMMGADPSNFTQTNIDQAIEYLFPSGLYDKKARPIMKPPKDIFPSKKAAQFDVAGRPFHSMFYTTRPHYYKILYDIVEHLNTLEDLEVELIRNEKESSLPPTIEESKSNWLNQEDLEKKVLEKLTVEQYEYFISTINRLLHHPLAFHVKDFIMSYRKEKKSTLQSTVIPEPSFNENGRPFVLVKDCKRKSARGEVLVTGQGSGNITINGKSLVNYFEFAQDREQVGSDILFQNYFSLHLLF